MYYTLNTCDPDATTAPVVLGHPCVLETCSQDPLHPAKCTRRVPPLQSLGEPVPQLVRGRYVIDPFDKLRHQAAVGVLAASANFSANVPSSLRNPLAQTPPISGTPGISGTGLGGAGGRRGRRRRSPPPSQVDTLNSAVRNRVANRRRQVLTNSQAFLDSARTPVRNVTQQYVGGTGLLLPPGTGLGGLLTF